MLLLAWVTGEQVDWLAMAFFVVSAEVAVLII